MNYIKFTGKYAELKDKGFEFQKLFANNYMQWRRDGIRVWKKGGDVTCENVDLYDVMKLVATGGCEWSEKGDLTVVKIYNKDNHNEPARLVNYKDGRHLVHNWSQSFADGVSDADREDIPEAYTARVSHMVFMAMDSITWEFCEGEDK